MTDVSGTDFNVSAGSDIFSIKYHKIRMYNYQIYHKSKDFDECTYVIKLEDDYRTKYIAYCERQNQETIEYIRGCLNFQKTSYKALAINRLIE